MRTPKPMRLAGLLVAAGLFAMAAANCVAVKGGPEETGGSPGGGGSGTGGRSETGGSGTGGDVITVDGSTGTGGVVVATGGKAAGGHATGGAVATGGVAAGGKGGSGSGGVGGGSASNSLHVQLQCQGGMSNAASLIFSLSNPGPTTVDMSTVTFRYWYTSDTIPLTMQTCLIEQVQPDMYFPKGSVTVRAVALDPIRTGADTYLEISFKKAATDGGAGVAVGPGGKISLVLVRLNTNVNPAFSLDNDYSCDPKLGASADNKKVTAYSDGVLIWGVEPT